MFCFKAAEEGMNAMSLIWPESYPLRNSPLAMSSSQKRPFSREQKVRLRELLWPAMGGTSSPGMEGGEPGAPAAAGEFGGVQRASSHPHKGLPPVEVGAGSQRGPSSIGEGQVSAVLFIGFIWRWELLGAGSTSPPGSPGSSPISGSLPAEWSGTGRSQITSCSAR